MITKREAEQLALDFLQSLGTTDELAFYEEHCVEKPYGWILYYNTKQFIETGNILYALGGNGPLVVIAATREVIPVSTAGDTKEGIRDVERSRGLV